MISLAQSLYLDKKYGKLKPHKKVCVSCGSTFAWVGRKKSVQYSRTLFCSRSCANKRINPGPSRSWNNNKKCAACKKNFIAKSKHQKCCSTECKRRLISVAVRSRPKPVQDLEYIKARCIIDSKSNCWLWQGAKATKLGYGHFQLNSGPKKGQMVLAHRLAYELTYGPVDQNLVVRHLRCSNPLCCNPAHLEKGTHKENYYDSLSVHLRAARKLQGRAAHNRIAVEINGVNYRSIDHACRSLRLPFEKVKKLVKIL